MSSVNSDAFQQMLLQLRNAFLEDMREKLDRLDQLLVAMEKTGVERSSFNEFYRIVHSLKGSGGTFGLHIVTTICHQLEDLLNTTGGGADYTPALVGVSLDYVDLLRMTLELVHAGHTDFPQVEERLSLLRKRLARRPFTVLVVDDSKLLSQIYLQALAELPVQLVIMNDGLVALRRVLTEPFDLLITTNEIPVLSGTALIGALKLSATRNHGIKTILVTSNRKIAGYVNRSTDSDHIIVKDAGLAQNLVDAAKRALSIDRGVPSGI
jgi:HPt (histidine-containing phosphotransfer) domain-containing protein